MKRSSTLLRYRTAWRELLHPLPINARRQQWLKRDTVEINEAILRQPYYTIKDYAAPAYINKSAMFGSAALDDTAHTGKDSNAQQSSYTMQCELKAARRAVSPQRLQELREQLNFAGAVGPSPAGSGATRQYKEEYGDRLRPRYPNSWDTIHPHQPSRSNL